MVNVTLDELSLNQIKAALDERAERLSNAVGYWQVYIDRGMASEDTQRAYVWNVAALQQTELAREQLSDPEVLIDHPADASYHDWQAVGPR